MSENIKRLICVGGGPKSAAIAVLGYALRLSLSQKVALTIIEANAIGGNWSGNEGYTDGEFPLDTSPFKDLGFPYRSGYGKQVDHELGNFSFVQFLKDHNEYASWVSRGDIKIPHRKFAQYLRWAVARSGADIIHATVTRIETDADLVKVTLTDDAGRTEVRTAEGVVLTGPGAPKRLPIQEADDDRIFNGRNYWLNIARFTDPKGGAQRVAVIGGGQTAGTIARSLVDRNPETHVDIITRYGFLCAQSAGLHENTLCTDPDASWRDLPLAERTEILRRINNGVVEASLKQYLDQHPRVRMARGSVARVCAANDHVRLHFAGTGEKSPIPYDRVVVATGFDPVEPLRSLAPDILTQAGWSPRLPDDPSVDYHFRVPGVGANIHAPALGGLSQGPGFMLLSCLGAVASRIVSAYIPFPETRADIGRSSSETPGFAGVSLTDEWGW